MKKILIIICFLTCWLGVSAQSLREVWIEMPDSILPYLSKSQRTELADYVEMKAEPAVLSTFGDSVRIERMTNNYLLLKANEATRLEIKLLDNNTLALVQTWMAPAAESKLSLFNLQWQPKEVVVDYKANIVKNENLGSEYLNLNPRILLVLFKQKNGSYILASKNDKGFIKSAGDKENPALMDTLDNISIKNNILKIKFMTKKLTAILIFGVLFPNSLHWILHR